MVLGCLDIGGILGLWVWEGSWVFDIGSCWNFGYPPSLGIGGSWVFGYGGGSWFFGFLGLWLLRVVS